ncbi:hypothetical protein SAMN05216267_1026111 [Actinacidiphila rubida]|uniref:Uncharacterized protein n=2 Tax=Actinacidiphila rubida TaxID=310780 RepID=A0A1H8PRK7_9ACTN|nr:hypothetical protein [Actinacidiphila rubida]SEO44314.1 hypothetical protein SAMN05216267_1026111 [Actinacidiphila rubida]
MRSPKSVAAVVAATAALLLGTGLGTAAASPAPAAPSAHPAAARESAAKGAADAQAAAAAVCSSAAAVSGQSVHGTLPQAEVRRQLSSLTAQHRAQYGIAAKGPLGTAARTPSARTPLVSIHPAQGTAFKAAAGADGSCATQSVSTSLTVADSYTTIYTPTMYPPGGSCVELVTVYTNSVREVAAWDWCHSVNFAASVPITSAFLSTYTNGTGAYTGRVIRTSASSNTWAAALYNYSTAKWDTLFSQSGTNQSGRTDGWDIEELYSTVASSGQAYSCGDMAGTTFESSGISVRNNGTWSAASSANADTHYDSPSSGFYCPSRSYQMISAYSHWKAVG